MTEASTAVALSVVKDSQCAAAESPLLQSLAFPGAMPLVDVSSQKKPSGITEAHARDNGPVPLSFPAILRNPKLADRYAHLRERPVVAPPKTSISKARRDEHE